MHLNKNNDKLVWIYLLCEICKKMLVKPKTLTCQHSFCFSCIEKTFSNYSFKFIYFIKKFRIKTYTGLNNDTFLILSTVNFSFYVCYRYQI